MHHNVGYQYTMLVCSQWHPQLWTCINLIVNVVRDFWVPATHLSCDCFELPLNNELLEFAPVTLSRNWPRIIARHCLAALVLRSNILSLSSP